MHKYDKVLHNSGEAVGDKEKQFGRGNHRASATLVMFIS